jgi:hypothetical protein
MNRRAFGTYVLAAFVLSVMAFIPSYSQAQLGPHIITGDWAIQSSGEKFYSGTIHMVQQGYTVVGHSTTSKGALQFSGKLNNNVLSGKWTGPTGETGWLTFTFAQSFLSFNGEFGYNGRKPHGTIIGKLVRKTPM